MRNFGNAEKCGEDSSLRRVRNKDHIIIASGFPEGVTSFYFPVNSSPLALRKGKDGNSN